MPIIDALDHAGEDIAAAAIELKSSISWPCPEKRRSTSPRSAYWPIRKILIVRSAAKSFASRHAQDIAIPGKAARAAGEAHERPLRNRGCDLGVLCG